MQRYCEEVLPRKEELAHKESARRKGLGFFKLW
jgi:hypothetical protein